MPLISDFSIIGAHVDTALVSVHTVTVPGGANGILLQVVVEMAFTYDGSAPNGTHGFRLSENLTDPPDFFPCEAGMTMKFIGLGTGAHLNYQFIHSTNGVLL